MTGYANLFRTSALSYFLGDDPKINSYNKIYMKGDKIYLSLCIYRNKTVALEFEPILLDIVLPFYRLMVQIMIIYFLRNSFGKKDRHVKFGQNFYWHHNENQDVQILIIFFCLFKFQIS